MSNPITDWFGTRLDTDDLATGLAAKGLADARLVIGDEGLRLEYSGFNAQDDPPSVAITWLRTKFSPLVPAELAVAPVNGVSVVDDRGGATKVVHVFEFDDPGEFEQVVSDCLASVPTLPGPGADPSWVPSSSDKMSSGLMEHLAEGWAKATCGLLAGPLHWVEPGATDFQLQVTGLHAAVWFRRGGTRGVKPSFILALTDQSEVIPWLSNALQCHTEERDDILLDGLVWGASRRPTVAVRGDQSRAIWVDSERCDECGICKGMCPTGYLDAGGNPTTPEPSACIRCFECVDACPVDALRPQYAADSATSSRTLAHRPTWLNRLRGELGPAQPASFTPSYLLPKASADAPRIVLGLALMTMQEHAAALVIDGELVGAVEEEKLARDRHYGWRAHGRPPFVTAAVDPTICLEEVLCRRSIRHLLGEHGLTLDDVDVLAVNGLHGRFRHAFSLTNGDERIPTLHAGRTTYVPHHLSHAASAYRYSENDGGWVFTVDGRGDRETAAVFEVVDGELVPRRTYLSLTDRSIGGVYEGVTRLLGFGSHGQGSVMALAGFGEPNVDLSAHLSVSPTGSARVHESGINAGFIGYQREFGAPFTQNHYDLAASLQRSLEEAALGIVDSALEGLRPTALALAGGVALNCHMNQRLRQHYELETVFAQPGANDGGTAAGAAAEAVWKTSGVDKLAPLRSAALGPAYNDSIIEQTLKDWNVPYRKSDDIAEHVAERIANGQVVAWFQGRLEYGPRALGSRSLVADPRSQQVKDRLNAIKTRQSWRPFGPSILAGHEADWFENAFDSRFMLFTLPVLEDKRELVPAVVHVDGTTRPQSVHPEDLPLYHALISSFHRRTNVPMVINTSFNRRGESIVCTPDDALESFWALRADTLAIGSFIVEHPNPLRLGEDASAMREPSNRAQDRQRPLGDATLYSGDAASNDQIAGEGEFARNVARLRRIVATGRQPALRVPLCRSNLRALQKLILIAQKLGASVIFELVEPAEHHHGIVDLDLVPLGTAGRALDTAVALAERKGVAVGLSGFPLCRLGVAARASQAPAQSPEILPTACRACALRAECPSVGPAYLEAVGTSGLRPAP
ncbi:MAG: carbamoyltransferase [Bradymonadia bacterium]|jgi:carbamoyltransferase